MSYLTMEVLQFVHKFLMSMIVVVGFSGLFLLFNTLVGKPMRLRSKLRKQGISGPPPIFMLGNITDLKKKARQHKSPSIEPSSSHDCTSLIFPCFEKWRQEYGKTFMFSRGIIQFLYVDQPHILRDITTCTSLDLGTPLHHQKEAGPLLGKGIITSNGTVWANQRKIIAPELYMDKVKGMITIISESASSLLNLWSSIIEGEGGTADIKIDEHIEKFFGDVITRACFGSNHSKGEEIFSKVEALRKLTSKISLLTHGIPGSRYLPTKSNRELWRLEKEVKNSILQVVEKRKESGHEKDLLQTMIEGAKNSDLAKEATECFIVDNCKNIYLGGFETPAIAAKWCLMLLASNQGWQDHLRAEAKEICGERTPDYDMLRKMKQLTMVIHESLRLYSPVLSYTREAFKDMKLGNINIPKGINLWIMVGSSHTNPDIWGPDAFMFNPERFANGVKGACKEPHMYMPFGAGPRTCIGQNLAMMELKMLITLILSKFSLTLSPNYIHSPAYKFAMVPKHGIRLLVKKL